MKPGRYTSRSGGSTQAVRRKVLFGAHVAWEASIRVFLDAERYDCVFDDFATTDIAKFDLAIPLSFKDYAALEAKDARARERALFPPRRAAGLCQNKLRLNRFLATSEFAWIAPPLLEAGAAEPPFILKRQIGAGGRQVHLVATDDDFLRLSREMADPDFFAQAYVPGEREFATHVLMCGGRPAFHLDVAYEMGARPYVKTGGFKGKTYACSRDAGRLALFVSLLTRLGFTDGTCCIDYKIHDGRVQLFEINPRFGASLALAINDYLAAYEIALLECPPAAS
jgi:glutathione synthase/RimK-type ligase-like ATP-grasp enzyme